MAPAYTPLVRVFSDRLAGHSWGATGGRTLVVVIWFGYNAPIDRATRSPRPAWWPRCCF